VYPHDRTLLVHRRRPTHHGRLHFRSRRSPDRFAVSDILERRCAQVPFEKAPAYFERYVRDVVECGVGTIVLRVMVPIERIGIDRRIETCKAVSVHFDAAADAGRGVHTMAISWEPEGGGPFPQFNGAISLEPDERLDRCCIVLRGAYDPPFGIAGDAFDALVGRHIARMTVRNLLDEIAIIMETSHASSSAMPAPADVKTAS
jgi:hypothetical protein